MKTIKNISSLLAVVAIFSVAAFAQTPDETATINATATVTGALTINTTDVQFGAIAATSNPNLQANANDAASVDVGAGAVAGQIALSAGIAAAELIASWTTATLGDGAAATMTFTPDIWVGATQLVSGTTVFALDGSGAANLDIGGDLGALSGQATGNYDTAASNGSSLVVNMNYQ